MKITNGEEMKIVFVSILVCGFVFSGSVFAQQLGVWNDVPESAIAFRGERRIIPVQYRTLVLNMDALVALLNQTPMEGTVALRNSPAVLSLPLPNGSYGTFHIVESPIMAPELAARYMQIRTYLGQGIDDPTASVRLDLTPAGFHAMILSAGPTVYIDPYSRNNVANYISYFKEHVLFDESKRYEEIGVVDPNGEMATEISRILARGSAPLIGEQLRTYRLALAATGEYTTFHGGTVAAGLAAMVTAMNRVTGLYEREVAVRMVLVANTDLLIYTNASTDPYTNNNGSTMLGQNQANIDNIIGSANYDIGHVFSTGGGGIAGLGVVCRSGQKAWGVTGLSSPIGDPFYVDYVAHEVGHQFGGNHSFNGNAGSCAGGNRNGSTAYEPGSGTTIMAYAGICSPQNTQNASDDYFHGISIDEIVAYTTQSSGNGCAAITATGNNPPVVDAGVGGSVIPLGTPFILTGGATDPDNDPLTFTWEEFDLGPAGSPNTPSGNAPTFRSYKGTGNPTRIFPKISDILNNTQTQGEILPSYARTLNFRLTARDNKAGGGGVGKNTTNVVVSGTAGPFVVTSPNTSVSWLINSTDTVKWDVANTNIAPVSCANVNILLSTDGGQTFPTSLAANTPNDGVQPVVVPNIFTETARVKIEAVNNIFFDISNVNFTLGRVAAPALLLPANNSTNLPTSLSLRWRSVSAATSYRLQVSRDAAFLSPIIDDSTMTDTVRAVTGLLNNTLYYWRLKAKSADGTSGWTDTWNFRTILAPPRLVAPANNAVDQASTLTLSWNFVLFITRYQLEVAGDSVFTTTIISDTTLTTNQRVVSLVPGTKYYWRVRATNAGGTSSPSAVWNFTTQQLPAQVALVSPANAAIITADSAVAKWRTTGTTNERYWFELATDSTFTTRTIDSTLTDTTRVVRPLVGSQSYWWRVRARNNAGWGTFSETRKFQTLLTSVMGFSSAPSEFSLSQNYPNPFNPSTVIRFTLPREAFVMLEVFNLIGERVAVLVDQKRSAGYYAETFTAKGLASGFYIYRLRAGEFVRTRKLVLVR